MYTVSSITGLEAACLDKDLIYFNFSGGEDFVPYEDMGFGTKVNKPERIRERLYSLMNADEIIEKL